MQGRHVSGNRSTWTVNL